MTENDAAETDLEPDAWDYQPDEADDLPNGLSGFEIPEPVRPIDWNHLTPDQAAAEWRDLDQWVTWLRRAYGLPATIIPPYWHRHDELVWELSALQAHWRACYEPNAHGSAPIQWHHDFAEARARLREWVSVCGTRIDRDRPTRQTTWPGEPPMPAAAEVTITDRHADFEHFVTEDAAARETD